jgi:hypothetical protein
LRDEVVFRSFEVKQKVGFERECFGGGGVIWDGE